MLSPGKASIRRRVDLEGVVFDKGSTKFRGHADFLAKPHIALKGDLELDQITLDYLKPIPERFQFSVRTGSLSTRGSIEYAPDVQKILLSNVSLTGGRRRLPPSGDTNVADRKSDKGSWKSRQGNRQRAYT